MGGEPVPRQQGKNDRSIPCLSNEIGPCRPYGFQGSYCVGGTSRDTNSKKSRMPSGMKKLRKCSSNCARVDALSMGWQDVLNRESGPCWAALLVPHTASQGGCPPVILVTGKPTNTTGSSSFLNLRFVALKSWIYLTQSQALHS